MALIKNFDVLGGQLTGTYWKASQINVNKRDMTLAVTLELFKNKDASDAGCPPLASRHFCFLHTRQELAGDLALLAYDDIKAYIALPVKVGQDGSGNPIMGSRMPELVGASDA